MTNFEYIKSLTQKELSHFLCEMVEEEFYKTHDYTQYHCEFCPMTNRCRSGHNGWMDWLMEEQHE